MWTQSSCTKFHTVIDISPLNVRDYFNQDTEIIPCEIGEIVKEQNVKEGDENKYRGSAPLSRFGPKCDGFSLGQILILPSSFVETRSVFWVILLQTKQNN